MCIAAAITAGFAIMGCTPDTSGVGDPPKTYPFDPNKETTLTRFSPRDVAVRTTLFLDGSNFGTDLSRIKVYVGGKPAPVISSNGKTIAAMTPRNAAERIIDAETGEARSSIRIELLKEDGTVHVEKRYVDSVDIKITTNVGTLTGKVDPATGLSSRVDGTFEEAEFQCPWWLELTKNIKGEKVLLLHDGHEVHGVFRSLREINLETGMVSTLLTHTQVGINDGFQIAMDPARDTLFIMNENWVDQWADRYAQPNIFYTLRSENFSKSYPYQYWMRCFSAVWFSDGSFYHNVYLNALIYKGRGSYNESMGMWDSTPLFSAGTYPYNAVTYFMKHPDELYILTTGGLSNVGKVMYDKEAKTLIDNKSSLVGVEGAAGYSPGVGSLARFNGTRQGVFVKNESYVHGVPGEDVYDFYFCDQYNHCIWKVTPNGVATLFAGRGSRGLDNAVHGWIDGGVIESARFYNPCGIAYDEETGIFYIADSYNRRIRTIMVE